MYIPCGSLGGRYQILYIYHGLLLSVPTLFFYDDLLYLNRENKTNADLDYGIMPHSFIIGTSHFGRQSSVCSRRRGRDRMVVGLTTTYAISAYLNTIKQTNKQTNNRLGEQK